MRVKVSGRDAVNMYLSGEWSFDQIYDWAITWWDYPGNEDDKESVTFAGETLLTIWEPGPNTPFEESVLKSHLRSLLATNSAAAD